MRHKMDPDVPAKGIGLAIVLGGFLLAVMILRFIAYGG